MFNSYRQKLRFKQIFIVFVIFFTFLFSGGEAFAQSGSGYWKLVKVISLGQNKPDIPERFRNRRFFTGESRSGMVSADSTSYQDEGRESLDSEAAGFVKWAQPPDTATPGQRWDGKYAATVTKNYSNYGRITGKPGIVTLEIDTGWKADDSANNKYSAYYSQKTGIFYTTDKSHKKVEKTSLFVFPTRFEAGEKDYLYVLVGARLSMGGGDNYNYIYQWTPEKPGEVVGHFRIIAKNTQGGIVKGLRVTVRDQETGKSKTLFTDKNGICKESFTGRNGRVQIMVTEIAVTPQTGYSIAMSKSCPSYICQKNIMAFPMKKSFEMSESNNFMVTYDINVPIFKMIVLALKWDNEKNRWIQCSANLLIKSKSGKRLMSISRGNFTQKGDKYELDFYIPASEIVREDQVTVLAYEPDERKSAFVRFNIPSYKSKPALNMLTLQLTNTAEKIARTKYDMYKYFLPIVGKEKARQIANLKINLDNSKGKPCYLKGVMYIPGNFDLNSDEFSETFMHEWTHHIMEVMASDPDIENKLGGAHEIWTKAPTGELAWDEGRAHFFSVLLTRGLNLPYNPASFNQKGAEPIIKSIRNSGESVEGVVTVALIDYYNAAGYKKTKDIISHFLSVNDHSKKTLGHPPRTSAEFFRVLSNDIKNREKEGKILPDESQKLLKTLNSVKAKYSITD